MGVPVPLLLFAPPTWTGCGRQPAEESGSAPERRTIPEVSSVDAGRHEITPEDIGLLPLEAATPLSQVSPLVPGGHS